MREFLQVYGTFFCGNMIPFGVIYRCRFAEINNNRAGGIPFRAKDNVAGVEVVVEVHLSMNVGECGDKLLSCIKPLAAVECVGF